MTKKTLPMREIEFIESMECLPAPKIPDGAEWTYEIKLDGYRLEAVKAKGDITLYSRRRNVLNKKFHYIASALDSLPENTIIDGELVALGSDGHPDFNLLQNFSAPRSRTLSITLSTSSYIRTNA